ncbi:MAG: class I SAM-dependent methyltransferase [Sandaracinaceae bacterium]|nr:class I SAM-dependent methyltransferase [Sandaracinaceae bacterium]
MKTPLPPHLSFDLPSPYEDPIRYDRTYRRRRMDVEFYRSMAKEKGGPVLELGIGTGRIAIPLARDGHLVVGIEKEPAMLERLRLKLRRETREVRLRVRWIAGDFRWMRFPKDGENETPRRFPLVIAPFNVFMHLYTIDDVESTLCAIRECLEPKGILAFDVRMPDMRTFFRNPERRYRCADLRNPQSGERLLVYERFEYDAF